MGGFNTTFPGMSNAAYAGSLLPEQLQQFRQAIPQYQQANAALQAQNPALAQGSPTGFVNGQPINPYFAALNAAGQNPAMGGGNPYTSAGAMQPRSISPAQGGAAPMSMSPQSAMQARNTGMRPMDASSGGSGGGGLLGNIFGFFGAGRGANDLSGAAYAGEQGVLGASQEAQANVQNSLAINSPAMIQAQNAAIGNVGQYGNFAQNLLGGNLNTSLGNINPFIQGGQFGAGAVQNLASSPYQVTTPAWQGANQGQGPPQFDFQPTQQQLEQTPGYQFQKQEGLNAITNSASAGGLGQSSNANLDAAKFATGLASQNYEQAFQNAAQTFGANQQSYNQAFQNAMAGTQANYGMAFQPAEALMQGGLQGTGQANSALLGFGVPGAQMLYNTGVYGGNAMQNTALFNAQQGLSGNEWMGNAAQQAAGQAGGFAMAGAGANAQGILSQYNNLAGAGSGLLNLAGTLGGFL